MATKREKLHFQFFFQLNAMHLYICIYIIYIYVCVAIILLCYPYLLTLKQRGTRDKIWRSQTLIVNMGVISLPIATIMMSYTDGRTPVKAPVEVSSLSMFIPLFTTGFSTIPGGVLAGFLKHQQ